MSCTGTCTGSPELFWKQNSAAVRCCRGSCLLVVPGFLEAANRAPSMIDFATGLGAALVDTRLWGFYQSIRLNVASDEARINQPDVLNPDLSKNA